MIDNENLEILKQYLTQQKILKSADNLLVLSADIRDDLGLDEFQIIELTGEIESRLGISIDTDEAEQARTVGDFLELIQRSSA